MLNIFIPWDSLVDQAIMPNINKLVSYNLRKVLTQFVASTQVFV